jgi:2-dehydropantoate 2-reductase
METLKILSIGAGAIGTYIGGSLSLAGHDVVFLERPDTAGELRKRGLFIKLNGSEHHIPKPEVAGSLESALASRHFDFAIYALKSYDTIHFLTSHNSSRRRFPPVLCLSNGVENETLIATVLGKSNVIAGTVTSAVRRQHVGDIVLERLRGIGIADGHPLSLKIVQAMDGAGLNSRLYPNGSDMKWSKMLTNLLANASSAILDMTPSEIFTHQDLYRIENKQLRETISVMQAQGIRTVNLPGTPVRLLALAINHLPMIISRRLIVKAVGRGRGAKMPSFHIDLYSGRKRSEVDYLNGAVVRTGLKFNIPTPVNLFLNTILLALTKGDIPLDTYRHQPDKYLKEFKYNYTETGSKNKGSEPSTRQ